MAKDQIYSSVIRLNTEDAQNKMEDLKKRAHTRTPCDGPRVMTCDEISVISEIRSSI